MSKTVQITILGDYNTGKHALVGRFIFKQFRQDFIKPIYQHYDYFVKIASKIIDLRIVIVARDLTKERPFENCIKSDIYTQADIVLLCFSMVSSESLQNIVQKWALHVQLYCRKNTPVLLVGTQCDLLADKGTMIELNRWLKQPVTREEALKVVEQFDFDGFIETSAKLVVNVEETFETAADLVLERRQNAKKCRFYCLNYNQ